MVNSFVLRNVMLILSCIVQQVGLPCRIEEKERVGMLRRIHFEFFFGSEERIFLAASEIWNLITSTEFRRI